MVETLPAAWLAPIQPQAHNSDDYKELFQLLCSLDWAELCPEIGPLEQWPYSLRTLVQLLFSSPKPLMLRWGKKLNLIYNVEYWREILGEKHPSVMGQPLTDMWPNRVGIQNPMNVYNEVMRTGRATFCPESLWFLNNTDGMGESENYISMGASPIYDDNSSLVGCLGSLEISTNRVIHLRRQKVLRSFVEATQDVVSMVALHVKLQHAFNSCEYDLPMCLVMLRDTFLDGSLAKSSVCPRDAASGGPGTRVTYRTFLAAGVGGLNSSKTLDFGSEWDADVCDNQKVFGRHARECHRQKSAVIFKDTELGKHCLGRAYGKTCTEAQLSPIYASDHENQPNMVPLGYILLGFSPATPSGPFYVEFTTTVTRLLTSAFQSIQEVMRSEARLSQVISSKQAGEKYFRIVDNSPIGIAVQNWTTKEILVGNQRWREILGYGENMALDQWLTLIHEDDLPGMYHRLDVISTGGQITDHQVRLKRDHCNGKPAWISISASFHYDVLCSSEKDSDVITWLSHAVADISQQVYAKETELEVALETERLRTARRREQERADEADRAKARQLDYIDTLAHEIRNPISSIVQSVEVLVEQLQGLTRVNGQDAKEIRQIINDLGTIDICTAHMSTVIDDALNVSKLEHGSLAITPQDCHILSHIKSVLRMLRQDMKNKGIECKDVEVDRSWSDHISCIVTDPLRFKQVVLNLLTNAVKFTAMSQKTKRISIKLYSEPDPLREDFRVCYCAITDSGNGMSEETIDKLFGKFYQGGNRSHVEYQGSGSGLGLYISQRLATLLQGKIDVVSELGVGSTFTFSVSAKLSPLTCQYDPDIDKLVTQNSTLKALKRGLEEIGGQSMSPPPTPLPSPIMLQKEDAEANLGKAQVADHGSPSSTEKGTILVVEDNLINQKLLVKQLRNSGYTVLVGNHGLEALDHFKKGSHIDLVLTDIEMPLMDGMECLRAVNALELAYTPPFVACSAYARAEQRATFLEAGMLDVIAKPYKFADLKPKIEVMMGTIEQRRANSMMRREQTI